MSGTDAAASVEPEKTRASLYKKLKRAVLLEITTNGIRHAELSLEFLQKKYALARRGQVEGELRPEPGLSWADNLEAYAEAIRKKKHALIRKGEPNHATVTR